MKKKITLLLTLLSILACIFFIKDSYAKYITSRNESTNLTVARWRILVNNNDIRNSNTTNTVITPVFDGTDNIKEGIIAPTSEGYFDLVIDATEADVSFKYKIDLSVNENSIVKDLIATKYTINNGEEITLDRDNQTIENTVLRVNNTSVINIRVFIKWDDGENATMDNTQDTQATNTGTAKMNVNLTFTQVN